MARKHFSGLRNKRGSRRDLQNRKTLNTPAAQQQAAAATASQTADTVAHSAAAVQENAAAVQSAALYESVTATVESVAALKTESATPAVAAAKTEAAAEQHAVTTEVTAGGEISVAAAPGGESTSTAGAASAAAGTALDTAAGVAAQAAAAAGKELAAAVLSGLSGSAHAASTEAAAETAASAAPSAPLAAEMSGGSMAAVPSSGAGDTAVRAPESTEVAVQAAEAGNTAAPFAAGQVASAPALEAATAPGSKADATKAPKTAAAAPAAAATAVPVASAATEVTDAGESQNQPSVGSASYLKARLRNSHEEELRMAMEDTDHRRIPAVGTGARSFHKIVPRALRTSARRVSPTGAGTANTAVPLSRRSPVVRKATPAGAAVAAATPTGAGSIRSSVSASAKIPAAGKNPAVRKSAADSFPNGDDPDKVPVVPSLKDDEVPNMPGAILKHAREMLGLSQREIAMRLYLRVNTISDIEHDRLNQPTAMAFAMGHIANYARLVNIDPQAVLTIYRQNVQDAQNASNRQNAQKAVGKSSSLLWMLGGATALAVLGVLIWLVVPSGSSTEEGALDTYAEAQSTSASADPFAEEAASSEDPATPALAAAADIGAEETAKAAAAAPAADSTQLPEPEPQDNVSQDSNTLMAQRQAEFLGTNEILSEEFTKDLQRQDTSGTETTASLNLNGSSAKTGGTSAGTSAGTSGPGRRAPMAESSIFGSSAATVQSGTASGSTTASVRSTAAATSQSTASPSERFAAGSAASGTGSTTTAGSTAGSTLAAAAASSNAAADTAAVASTEEAEKAPALASGLRDISDSVRVVNRKEIGSLNSAVITVNAPVSMKIVGGNGKLLASGSYQAGDKVSVIGIAPLKIDVTDASKIIISYNGGTVEMPSLKQVSFKLPMR